MFNFQTIKLPLNNDYVSTATTKFLSFHRFDFTRLDGTCGQAEAGQVGQGQVDGEVEDELDGVDSIAGNLATV